MGISQRINHFFCVWNVLNYSDCLTSLVAETQYPMLKVKEGNISLVCRGFSMQSAGSKAGDTLQRDTSSWQQKIAKPTKEREASLFLSLTYWH